MSRIPAPAQVAGADTMQNNEQRMPMQEQSFSHNPGNFFTEQSGADLVPRTPLLLARTFPPARSRPLPSVALVLKRPTRRQTLPGELVEHRGRGGVGRGGAGCALIRVLCKHLLAIIRVDSAPDARPGRPPAAGGQQRGA